MDADRFDDALRLLAAGLTRREALRVLGGLGLAALLGERGIDAKGKKHKGKKRKGKKKRKRSRTASCRSCPVCQTCSGGQCVADPAQNRTTCAGSGLATSVCCNGVCCDGCCGADGSCGPCRAFVTSTTYTSNLEGLAGADAKCQERAAAGNQPGTYMAWLSDATGSPDTRFRRSARPYQKPNGVDIASSYANLVAGSGLEAALDWTELGDKIDTGAWTNTLPDGTPGAVSLGSPCPPTSGANAHCTNWTGSGTSGGVGLAGDTTCHWTAFATDGCMGSNRLYCFQQR